MQVFSKTASHINMWSMEGAPSAESVILTLTRKCAVYSAVTFSAFCTATKGLRLNHSNCSAYLYVATVLHLGVLDF